MAAMNRCLGGGPTQIGSSFGCICRKKTEFCCCPDKLGSETSCVASSATSSTRRPYRLSRGVLADTSASVSASPLNQASLDVVSGLIAAARGDAAVAAQWAASSRAVLDGVRFKDQHHLPLAQLDIDAAIAAGDGQAAVAAAANALDRYDLPGSLTRYGWPVLVSGARACLLALRPTGGSHDEAARESAATSIRLKLARQNPPSSAAANAPTRKMSASVSAVAP